MTKSQLGAGIPNISWTASRDLVCNTFGDDRYYEGTISDTAATTAAVKLLYT